MALRTQRRDLTRRPDPVTPARWVAFRTCWRAMEDGAYADRAFRTEADIAGLDIRDRAFAQRLAWGSLQQQRLLDHIISTVGKRPLKKIDRPLLHAVRLGLY